MSLLFIYTSNAYGITRQRRFCAQTGPHVFAYLQRKWPGRVRPNANLTPIGQRFCSGSSLMSQTQVSRALPKTWRGLVADRKRSRQITARIRRRVAKAPDVDPIASAEVAGLRYVSDLETPGIRRLGGAKRFRYLDSNGRRVSGREVLQRIRSLAIPPAWRDVWICPNALGHLQATGRDARGRKQYRYHPRWREIRDEVKYGRLIAFSKALPRIREQSNADLRRPGLPRRKVLAAVVQLLEKTLIRVGNDEYARENNSFGLTTMRDQHARVNGATVRFEFRGKSRVLHSVDLSDARLARIVKQCRDLPGHELFQYVGTNGRRQVIGSSDVNDYLREMTGETFTSKDFRTWAGTVLAARELAKLPAFRSQSHARRNVVRAVESVSKRLGNTKAVCRKSYIHPAILEAYMAGEALAPPKPRGRRAGRRRAGLAPEESIVVAMIQRRLS
jgi:DNA topoisomerase-1